MSKRVAPYLWGWTFLVLLAACGAGTGTGARLTTGGAAANGNTATDGGNAALQILALGNDIIPTPNVHLVTFAGSPSSAGLEGLLTALPAHPIWATQTAEYGVGSLSYAGVLADGGTLGATLTSGNPNGTATNDIEALVAERLSGIAPAWTTATNNDIFVLLLPTASSASPTATASATACAGGYLAWHGAVSLTASQVMVPYIAIPDCPAAPNLSVADTRGMVLQQALVETVTNPRGQGFGAIGATSAGWLVASEAPEMAAICTALMFGHPDFISRPSGLPTPVARTFSNHAAKTSAGPPCVPQLAANEAFATAEPQLDQLIDVGLRAGEVSFGPGLALAASAHADVTLALYANRSDKGAIGLKVAEVGSQDLTLALSSATGTNGENVKLSITQGAAPKAAQQLVQISTTQGAAVFNQYVLVRVKSAG